ncbi:uncharacterized protein LOC131678773 isoform X2 [Topomyia yanbarensis]|uniref:uncharacterized protein LOC131678773 isoform X2 n=1 Tax=Topomyia yanbarensis TaxID=2498891 RepID=UPI00273B8C02|nr:uncharacterized protein LOC131678773 isoform X2 [Topomyia yanbarensis]
MSMMGDMVQRTRTMYVSNNPPVVATVMSLEESRRTQRPYRYGMILLCVGALVNWLGLAENYSEPIRYTGVACILAGACLICTAMCCWLHTPNRSGSANENDDPVHVISSAEERRCEKPPDYDSVAVAPPSYDDAIKLDPSALLHLSLMVTMENNSTSSDSNINSNLATTTAASNTTTTTTTTTTSSTSSATVNFPSVHTRSRDSHSTASDSTRCHPAVAATNFGVENEIRREIPPRYEAIGSQASAPPHPAIVAAIPFGTSPGMAVLRSD